MYVTFKVALHQRHCQSAFQAQASRVSKAAETSDSRFKGFDEFMASAKAEAAPKPEPEGTAGPQEEDVPDLPYSPSRNLTSDDEDAGLLDLTNLIGSSNLTEKQVCKAHPAP